MLVDSATNSMLISIFVPLAFQVFMSVGMNRVWSLYLMLQIACNLKNIPEVFLPDNIMTIV